MTAEQTSPFVMLHYEAFNRIDKMRCNDTLAAMDTAVDMASKQLGKPLYIIHEDGTLMVDKKTMARKVEQALTETDEQRQKRIIKSAAAELRKQRESAAAALEQARARRRKRNDQQRALEALPGFGSF